MIRLRWAFSMTFVLLLSLLSGVVGGVVIDADTSAGERAGITEHGRPHPTNWVNITSPADGEILDTMEVTVVGTAFADFHVDSVELSTDGENWVPAIVILTWGDLHRGGAPEDRAGPLQLPMNAATWSGRIAVYVGVNTIFARATDQSERSAMDSVSVTVSPQVPSAPGQLLARAAEGQVRLTWSRPLSEGSSPITLYRIYRGTTPGSLTFLAEVGNVFAYSDLALTEGVAYVYQVSAGSAIGEGPRSNEVSARAPDITVPTIAIVAPGPGSILTSVYATVSGTASDNVQVARVELSLDGTHWVVATGTASWSGTLTLTEADNTIHARATDLEGNTATVTTAVTVATAPTGSQVSPTTAALTVFGILAAVGAVSALLIWRRASGRG